MQLLITSCMKLVKERQNRDLWRGSNGQGYNKIWENLINQGKERDLTYSITSMTQTLESNQ